jgi:type II secretory pathway pseudopilin PulG
MKTLARVLAAWACLGMLIGPVTQNMAADPPSGGQASPKAAAGGSPDLTYIPAEAVAAAVVHPQVTLAGPDADWLPLEVLTAWGMKELGFDPVKIKEVVAFVSPRTLVGEAQIGVVVRFSEAYSKDNVAASLPGARETIINGKSLLGRPQPGGRFFYFPDDRTIVLGSAPLIKAMIAAKDVDSAVTKLLKEGDISGLLTAVVSLDDVRDQLKEAMREAAARAAQAPPEIRDFLTVPDLLSAVVFRISGSEKMTISLTLRGRDEASAEQVERIIKRGLDTARRMILMQATADVNQPAGNDALKQAIAKYSSRMSERTFSQIKPARDGRDVRISVESDSNVAMIGVLVALLLPAVQASREAARRVQSLNNMRQIQLAMLNYHSAHGKFPARAIFDKAGKPLLSWRVQILPFIEGKALQQQFHLDEPWDSEHNKQLIAAMPSIYRNPNRPADNKTNYLLPVGKGTSRIDTLFGSDKGVRIRDIHDGTSKTVMIVETDENRAVIWTKPDDLEVDMDHPRAGLGGFRAGGILVGLCDGSVRMLRPTISDKTLKALFTENGGEIIDPKDL